MADEMDQSDVVYIPRPLAPEDNNMPRSRLDIARPQIAAAISSKDSRFFRHKDLVELLTRGRDEWKLPQGLGFTKFQRFLVDEVGVKHIRLALPHRSETLYVLGEAPVLAVAVAAKAGSYLTHSTAMGLHELTRQSSKTIYVNVEQREQPSNPGSLTQESIDRAFRGAQRRTTNVAVYDGFRLMYLNGKQTGQLGVIEHRLSTGEIVRVTDVERTLIDIAVRPAYSGGVAEVANAYRVAKERVSVERLALMLNDMRFVYPYRQAIGFYLQRAGVADRELDRFRREPMRFDFYLAHGIREREHVPEWRLFIPKGL